MSGAATRYIYFLRALSGEGLIKIGCSVYPENRRRQISRELRLPLELMTEVRGDFRQEKSLHRAFAGIRVRGEWFKPDDRLLSLIERCSRSRSVPSRFRKAERAA